VAEIASDPTPEDPLGKRIRDYLASPQAFQHLQEGFTSQSVFTSGSIEKGRRYSFSDREGELHQRGAFGQEVNLVETSTDLICIWCGEVCVDLEALDAHEADCEP
jgi:hypothetical protein